MRRTTAWLFTIVLAVTTGAVLSGTVTVLTAPIPSSPMGIDRSSAVVWAFYDAANTVLETGDTAPIDALLAEEMVEHHPAPGLPPTASGLTRHLLSLRATMPNLQLVPEEVFASGDQVMARVRLEEPESSVFLGLPVREDAAWGSLDHFRVVDQRIIEHWRSSAPDVFLEPLQQASLGRWFTPDRIVALERYTAPPGSSLGASIPHQSHLIYLESGQLTVDLDPASPSSVLFTAAGSTGSDVSDMRPREVAPGTGATLSPGDLLALPTQTLYTIRNDGDLPAVALVLAAYTPYDPVHTTRPVDPVFPQEDVDSSRRDIVVAVVAPPTGFPAVDLGHESTAVGLGRATLAPGRTLELPGSTGPLLLVAESGALGFAVDEGTAEVRRGADGVDSAITDGILAAGDGALVPPGIAINLRNVGHEPATVLLVTILPDNTQASVR